MIVADRVRRKRKITATTSAMVNISENSTSFTDARMVLVRSVSTLILTAAGSVWVSVGSSALMLSTTVMMLAAGCRCTLTMTAGVEFIVAAWRTSSTEFVTVATFFRRTGALLR